MRIEEGTDTILCKIKIHRSESLNETVDDLADLGHTIDQEYDVLSHKLQICTEHQLQQWSLMCSGRVVQDRIRQQQRNGPVDRLYLWKE